MTLQDWLAGLGLAFTVLSAGIIAYLHLRLKLNAIEIDDKWMKKQAEDLEGTKGRLASLEQEQIWNRKHATDLDEIKVKMSSLERDMHWFREGFNEIKLLLKELAK